MFSRKGDLSAQIIQQKVPLQIVTGQNQADYILTGQPNATAETRKGAAGGGVLSGIVNPERRGRNGAQCFGHATPVFSAQMSSAKLVCVDLRNGSDETL